MVKGGQELASVKNGSFDDQGVFSGIFSANPGVAFQSKGFDITLDELNLNAAYSFKENKVTFKSGSGQLTVSNIKGLQNGVIRLGIESNDNETLEAKVSTENTEISALGFVFDPGELQASITPEFELVKIYGEQLSAEHTAFDSDVNVQEFLIEEGTLSSLNAFGDVKYKGFDFSITNANYANKELSLDAVISLNLTGTQGRFAVKDFIIKEDGSVSIREIEGDLDKENILDVHFRAAFGDTRFQGTFVGDIKPIGLDIKGDIDIGKETSAGATYYFAYLNLESGLAKGGLPLGPTGLKLDKVGGRLGYNYRLDYNADADQFTGNPKKGNYLIGLTMGISDVTETVSLEGSPTIQFGGDTFDFNLQGQLNIPKEKSIISSAVTLNYSYPSNSLIGNFTTDIKLPVSTGSIFSANIPVDFKIAESKWELAGTGINGQVLGLVDFNGGVLFDGTLDPELQVNNIKLNGALNFKYNRSFSFRIPSVLRATLTVDAAFTARADIEVGESGLAAEFGGHVHGALTADASVFFIDFSASANIDAEATVGYNSEFGGYMDAKGSFRFKDFDFSVPLDVGYRFDGKNSTEVEFDPDDPDSGVSDFGTIEGDKLIVRSQDIKRITAQSDGGVNIKAFEDIKRVELRGLTFDLPAGLRIKAVGRNDVFIPGFCFVAGTPVKVSINQTVPIEDIVIGDEVVRYHHACGGNRCLEKTTINWSVL